MGDVSRRRPRGRIRWAIIAGLAAGALAVLPACTDLGPGTQDADAAPEAPVCDAGTSSSPEPARHINLVLDDSGSMFFDPADPTQLRQRWSQAKYALEVFAAMLGGDDALDVYRLSDFAGGRDSGPVVEVSGSDPASARVEQIHGMQLQGGNTPYAPVIRAYEDLVQETSQDKWLVVLSDGAFEGKDAAAVQADLQAMADADPDGGTLRIAFLSIGDDAPVLEDQPESGLFFEEAPGSDDLLDKMTGFSNRIFERALIPSPDGASFTSDMDLSEVLVFAQGGNVDVVGADVGSNSLVAGAEARVGWAENGPVRDMAAAAEPDTSLNGVLAEYTGVPQGRVDFDVAGASKIDFFYKPEASFGVQLRDSAGTQVEASKVVGGDYTVDFGFMDANCSFIQSELLGAVEYSAQVREGDKPAVPFQSGDVLELGRGQVELDVRAEYLDGYSSEATIDLTVLQAARPTGFTAEAPVYAASRLGDGAAELEPIVAHYGLEENGRIVPMDADAWASVAPESITVSTDDDIEFSVALGATPGEILITPRAPNGDVFATTTGEVEFELAASHTFDEQLYEAKLDTSVTVQDDIPWFDRFLHWFAAIGWLWLLALILFLLILGYIIKPRFSKKIKPRPTITGVPQRSSMRSETGNGRFRVQSGRKLLPYVADQASLVYVPQGVSGFRPMKVKARRGGKMTVVNWTAIADRKNVEVNGTAIDEDTKRPPVLGAATSITAVVPGQMRYELYLNN